VASQDDQTARMVAVQTFRNANDGIARKAGEFGVTEAPLPFVCECSDRGCRELAHLTLGEYEEVRSEPNRFLVVPGHDGEAHERTLKATDRYVMVAKEGEAGRIAAELDSRGDLA
jgi:hypothetical protein